MKAIVRIMPRQGVLDPQGKAIGSVLEGQGFGEVQGVRQGKILEIEIEDGLARDALESRLNEMCEKILTNPVMEDFTIEFSQG